MELTDTKRILGAALGREEGLKRENAKLKQEKESLLVPLQDQVDALNGQVENLVFILGLAADSVQRQAIPDRGPLMPWPQIKHPLTPRTPEGPKLKDVTP